MTPSETSSVPLKRVLVGSLIASLCVAAAVAIVAIVANREIDETTARILGSVAALTVYGLTALASNSIRATRPDLPGLGEAGLCSSLVGLGLALVAIWAGDDSETAWRAEAVALTVTLAVSHCALFLRAPGDRLGEGSRVIRGATVAVTTVLAGLICVQVLSFDGEAIDWRVIAVTAVLFLLGNVLVPLFRLLERRR